MNSVIKKIICISFVLITVISHEECDHNKKQTEFEEILKHNINVPILNRRSLQSIDSNFQSGNLMPIRITYNVDLLEKTEITIDLTQKEKILQIIEIIVRFMANFIKVHPNPSKNMPLYQQCSDIRIPTNDFKKGIESSDFHVYFNFVHQPNKDNRASAAACSYQQIGSKVRPNFGLIEFNFANLNDFSTNTREFNLVLMTTVHEFMHLLGFSGSIIQGKEIPEFKTEIGLREYFYQRNSKDMLKSPNVLATAKKYFGCDTLKGVPLQKGGSHWDKTIFLYEIMAPINSDSGRSLSVFTVALLKDLNLWEDINENLTEPYFWGKDKGCDFPKMACKGTTNYEEFSMAKTKQCSFKYDGQSTSEKISPKSNCSYLKTYSDMHCNSQEKWNDELSLLQNNLQNFDHESKCFNSNIKQFFEKQEYYELETLCLLNKCEINKNGKRIIKVILPNDSKPIICGPEEQNIQKIVHQNGKNIGTINCPSNYERFCGIKRCKDDCHFNGICIRGICHCLPGYKGENCKDPCPNRECKLKCTKGYANPNNTCQRSCPTGYYGNRETKRCELCDFSCSECKGPNSNDCLACQFLTKLVGNQCVRDCPRGEYYNQTTQSCEKCSLECVDCTSKTDCNTCSPGFKKVKSICVNSNINQDSIKQTNRKLKQCPPGQYLSFQGYKCVQCSNGCLECSSSTNCSACNTNLGFQLFENQCQKRDSICDIGCLTCKGFPSVCTRCIHGFYKQGTSCLKNLQ